MGYKATSFADTTLASNITVTSTTLELATGKGDDFPTLTSADWTLVVLTDKNGNREVIRIVARSGDNLTVGTTVGAGANVSGRGYESTMALAITYTDDHSVRCAPTGALIQAMADYSDQGDLTSTTAEISTLHSSGITNADLVKVHAITATKDELNILDGITSTTAELNILDGVTADKDELNILDGVTATTDELNTLDGVTVSTANINTAGALCKDIDATAIEIDTVCDGPTAKNEHRHSVTDFGDLVVGTKQIGSLGGTIAKGITSWTKGWEAALPRGGSVRIKTHLSAAAMFESSTFVVYARIYRNGAAVGVQHSLTAPDNSTVSEDWTEDITGWSSGDLIQVYIMSNVNGYGGSVVCRIGCNNPISDFITGWL